MADSSKADDGRGAPATSPGTTTTERPGDPRLIPGGRFGATPIGVNAIDRKDLPSYGVSAAIDYTDLPENLSQPPRSSQ